MAEKWVVPCNPRIFDLVEHFKTNTSVVWKNISKVEKGDIVYIYLGAPHKEMRYKCIVKNENVDNETLLKNEYAKPIRPLSDLYQVEITYMELELIEEFPIGAMTYWELRENGLGQVQVQSRVSEKLQMYIDTKESTTR